MQVGQVFFVAAWVSDVFGNAVGRGQKVRLEAIPLDDEVRGSLVGEVEAATNASSLAAFPKLLFVDSVGGEFFIKVRLLLLSPQGVSGEGREGVRCCGIVSKSEK